CSDCWVFACDTHAERDTNLGKWKCFGGVAKLLSAGAALDDESPEDIPITSSAELSSRFPRIAALTEGSRAEWTKRTDAITRGVGELTPERSSAIADSDRRLALLADAVGIVRYFVPREKEFDVAAGVESVERPRVEGRIGQLADMV